MGIPTKRLFAVAPVASLRFFEWPTPLNLIGIIQNKVYAKFDRLVLKFFELDI